MQTAIVLLVVALAALYLGARAWRAAVEARRAKTDPGCGTACGCGTTSPARPERRAAR